MIRIKSPFYLVPLIALFFFLAFFDVRCGQPPEPPISPIETPVVVERSQG